MNNRYVVPMGAIENSSYLNLTVKSAEDNELIGTNRKRYVDLRSGLWNVSLGYNKKLYKEVSEAFSDIFSLGIPYLDIHSYNHPIYNEYAIKLLTFMNDKRNKKFSRVFYTNSGSEGTELSVKIIDHLVSNNKNRILAFKEGYHGTFFAGMSVSGIDQTVTSEYRLPSGVSFVDCPTDSTKMREIKSLIENQSENIAAFFIEPVVGSSGTIIMNKDYIEEIISICKKNNIVVIFDEVATGFYRTGKKFYYTNLIESPDIVILSKGINNGILPFGAVVINEQVEKILGKVHIEHFSTQNGNILGITSALKSLEYYVDCEDKIIENISEINRVTMEIMDSAEINYRLLGLMLSIPINNSSKTIQLVHQLANLGILVYHYDNTKGDSGLTIFPSLLMDIKMFKKVLNIIAKKVVK